ncbi:unnamed protein product [Symbiodinium sp. CCMP2592]|nr:unnamed protein product [Symbiodinium sp. CCMP2592]
MGNICECCGVRAKGPASLPEHASGGNAGCGYALAKNDRTRMEDAVVLNDNVAGHRCYAVVDGHGGDRAAMFLQEMLPSKLGQHLQGSKTKEHVVMDTFAELDEELKLALLQQEPKAIGRTSGAVACVATIQGKELLLANLGDCRAVVCEGGQVKFATADHSPVSNKLEKERLQALGVAVEGGYVGGELQVTRAFGDLDGETGQKLAGLISTPEVAILEISDDTEFVLIASDGIWDGLRDQLALTTARKILRETRSPQAAAQGVLEAAGKVTKADNAAVVVVALNIPEPLPKREPRQNRFQLKLD